MNIDLSNLGAGPLDAANILEQAADEFDRRAMLPTISPGFEQARVMACGQWLRDMAYDLRNPD